MVLRVRKVSWGFVKGQIGEWCILLHFQSQQSKENVRFKIGSEDLQATIPVHSDRKRWLNSEHCNKTKMELNFSNTKGRRASKHRDEQVENTGGQPLPSHNPLAGDWSIGCVEHMELFLNLQMLFSVIRPSVFANWHPWKLGFYPPMETRREGCSVLSCWHFKEKLPRSLRKTFLSYVTGKNLLRRFLHLKGTEKEVLITRFPKSKLPE